MRESQTRERRHDAGRVVRTSIADHEESVIATISLQSYFRATRRTSFNVFMVTALLAVYEAGVLLIGSERRNAADVMLKSWLAWLGLDDGVLLHALLLGVFLIAAGAAGRKHGRFLREVPLFFLECALYAALLAPVIFELGAPFLARPVTEDLLLDLGAGVYEEIVFRLMLLGGAAALLRIDPWHAFFDDEARKSSNHVFLRLGIAFVVVLTSSAWFAAYHHIGDGGEPWTVSAFTFRFVAGLLFALLYFARGIAVCVYAHAFYDLLVHVLG